MEPCLLKAMWSSSHSHRESWTLVTGSETDVSPFYCSGSTQCDLSSASCKQKAGGLETLGLLKALELVSAVSRPSVSIHRLLLKFGSQPPTEPRRQGFCHVSLLGFKGLASTSLRKTLLGCRRRHMYICVCLKGTEKDLLLPVS